MRDFDLPLAVAASSAFPPLFPPISIDAEMFGIARAEFGVDVDHLSDGGVFDNLGLSPATNAFWNIGVSLGRDILGSTDILVSDASASFVWKTRNRFWNIAGRTARSMDILMKRVAELEVESERIGLSAAVLQIEKQSREVETDLQRENPGDGLRPEGPRSLSDYPLPKLCVARIDGAQDGSVHFEGPSYNGRQARREPIRSYGPPKPSALPWAKVMASVRTDLDRFSKEECRFLEMWGYEQATNTWRSPIGPPGSWSKQIGDPPTDAQLRKLQKSALRKYRLITLRDPVGLALMFTWCLLAGFLCWLLAPGIWLTLVEWITRFFR